MDHTAGLNFTAKKVNIKNSVPDLILQTVSALLLFVSVNSITLLFNITLNFPAVILTAVACIILYTCTFPYKKSRIIPAAASALFIILLFLFGFYYISNGFLITVNCISIFIGSYFGVITPQYNISCGADEYVLSATFFFMLCAVVFSLITYHIVYSKNIILAVILLLFISFLFIAFSNCVTVPMIITALFPFAVFFFQYSAHSMNAVSVALITVISVVVLAIISLFFICVGLNNSLNITNAAAQVVDNIRYQKEENNALINGDFAKLNSFKIGDTKRLEVVMDNPQPIYLRGYVGSKYTNNGWTEIENEKLYENSDLFYWLHQDDFYGQSQIASALKCSKENTVSDLNNVSVKNIGANSKYIYTPYEIDGNNLFDKNKIGDINTLSQGFFGSRYYTYSIINEENSSFKNLERLLYDEENAGEDKQTYLADEAAYRKYVYENFTDISDDVSRLLSIHLSGEKLKGGSHLDYNEAESEIRRILEDVEYTDSAVFNEDEDFLQSFLTVNSKGCYVHFATASALMFRYYGIPSRYVEGYRISDDDITGVLSNSPIDITDKNAYAWAEYYMDGIGWVPFEFKGYIGDEPDNMGKQPDRNESGNKNSAVQNNINAYMQQDNISTNSSDSFSYILLTVFIILALFAIIITYIAVGRVRLNKRMKQLILYDEKKNIINTYAYIISLLSSMGIYVDISSINKSVNMVKNRTSEKYFKCFKKSVPVFNEAKFSNHKITKEAENQIANLKRITILEIKRNLPLIKRIKLRFINFLY